MTPQLVAQHKRDYLMSTHTPNPATDTHREVAARSIKPRYYNNIHAEAHNQPKGIIMGYLEYPTDFPMTELTLIGESLLNKELDKAALAHAAWTCSGYALGQTFGSPTVSDHPLMKVTPPKSKEEAHTLVKECAANKVMPSWIIPLIFQVLQTVLQNVIPAPAPAPSKP